MPDKADFVPAWDGNPSSFETYVTACKWYEKGTKQSERNLVVARLWGQLSGAAKSVVRYLDPDVYDGDDGLKRFLDVLRSSPLQQLPVPDSFSRLERWSSLKRHDKKSVAEMIVREEELFTELQQSLLRARKDRATEVSASSVMSPTVRRDPPSTPSRSPTMTQSGPPERERGVQTMTPTADQASVLPTAAVSSGGDFFEDELRGYRLLRACRLSGSERQNVLVQTGNSTSFVLVRRALRTLFSEESDRVVSSRGQSHIWFEEWDGASPTGHDDYDDSVWWNEWDEWQEWPSSPSNEAYWQEDDSWWEADEYAEDEVNPNEQSEDPEEVQLVEAYNLASEAHRTLRDAREAVRRVRQSRGYYAPESSSGKGMVPPTSSPSSSPSHGKGGKSSGKGFGPCFICGMSTHGYRDCPDRFSKGRSKGKGKFSGGKGSFGKSPMRPKGKGKGTKGKTYFIAMDLAQILSAQWDADVLHGRTPSRAILDTGASENAIGMDCLDELIKAGEFSYSVDRLDLPTFRFGNGQRDQAVSRVDLAGTSLGSISFYALGGMAKSTPPLIGARTLRGKNAMLSYADGLFWYNDLPGQQQKAVQMKALSSGHLTIDLAEVPTDAQSGDNKAPSDSRDVFVAEAAQSSCLGVARHELSINMFVTEKVAGSFSLEQDDHVDCASDLSDRLQLLASKLASLRSSSSLGAENGREASSSMRRSEAHQVSMLWSPQAGQGKEQPVQQLDELLPMRPSSHVCVKEQLARSDEADGPRASPHPSSLGGPREECSSIGLHGATGQWQTSRTERSDAPVGIDVEHDGEYDVPGVLGEDQEAWTSRRAALNSGPCRGINGDSDDAAHAKGNNADTSRSIESFGKPDLGGGEPRSQGTFETGRGESQSGNAEDRGLGGGSDQTTPDCRTAEGRHGGDCSCENGERGQESTSEQGDSRRKGDPRADSGSGMGVGQRGVPREQEEISSNGIWGLWNRLKNLRQKMTPGMGSNPSNDEAGFASTSQTTTSGSLELVGGSQALKAPSQSHGTFEFAEKTVNPSDLVHGVRSDSIALAQPIFYEQGRNSIKAADKTQSRKNIVMPSLAKKLATSVAVRGAAITQPVQGLMAQLHDSPDFVEIACAPNSALTEQMEDYGFTCKRINYKSGYDLSSTRGTSMLKTEMKLHPPRFSWVSLPCTRLTSLQNLTERSEEEWCNFEKRVGRDLKRADEVAEGLCEALDADPEFDFAWEWPTSAAKGWKSKAIQRLLGKLEKIGRPAFWCRFHGCAYGLCFREVPVLKGWTVLTSNRRLWMSLQKKCPGHLEHAQCRGVAAQASAYYPQKLVQAICKAIVHGWQDKESDQGVSLHRDVEQFLLEIPLEDDGGGNHIELYYNQKRRIEEVHEEYPEVFALGRTTFPKEPPTGRKLELIKQQMLRIHRSSGHSSFGNLQRLLRARKAPPWSIELAGNLQCPACIESKKPMLHPPASTKDDPTLFEVVGTDVFEFEHGTSKHKLILWRDRASGYIITDHLMEYKGRWEPTAGDVINSFTKWLMVNPSPSWILSDAGPQFTSDEFQNFCVNSGMGLLTAPAEAHWMLGAEEGSIKILKASVGRLLKEEPELTVANAFALAAHGANHTIGPSGFSAFQWVRGGATPQEPLLSGLDPKKAFQGLLRLKEKARIAFEQEHAKYKLSKLNNALGRSPASFKPGALVMIWRQRMRPGKVGGHWQGPCRVLLQEGSTVWLGSGASIIRAKTNQCRDCTNREELQATLEGVAVYKQPVNLETLLRSFTGKHYTNITGEAPSAAQMAEDLAGTDVRLEPDPLRQRPDERRGMKRPQGVENPRAPGHDQKKKKKAEAKAEDVQPAAAEETPLEIEGRAIPATPRPGTPVPEALEASFSSCTVTDCVLPGGHSGPHKDENEKTFSWTNDGGRVDLEGDLSDTSSSTSSSSSSSSSSEELQPDVPMTRQKARVPKRKQSEKSTFYALEIEVDKEQAEYLMAHPRKAAIWLSKKMQEKSKEHSWQQLPLERKKDFDVAQAKELSNVLQSKALRTLTKQEEMNLNPRRCMQMRWVLTTKASGDAKARLVILGFQQHNLTEVQAAAPTMNRISRNMLLTMCANLGLRIRSGDVTSAFLQASQSLESEDLVVWATPELAVLFGAPPERPWLPLKVMKAFYGLVHAPRAWYNDVSKTLQGTGWRKLVSDGCLFLLMDGPEVVGLAGIHVDDFLIGGKDGNPVFEKAISALESAYRWGKWDFEDFIFAGCRIRQDPDFTIHIDQNDYTDKWVEEVELSPERSLQRKSPATASEISQLRGLIGTLAWRSSQTSPHFQADVGLLLSEIPYASVDTILRANKLVREVRRTPQSLMFPCWNLHWTQLAIVVWADASNSNRPDKSSTMGIIAGCAPKEIISGKSVQVALIQWRSSKTPRQCLGSNGAEVQSITEGEDLCFRLRALLAEINGETLNRQNLIKVVKEKTCGALVMDSRGIYDSMTRNVSSLHGLRSGRAGYELTLSVSQAKEIETALRWVNGDAQLGDALTKGGAARKMLLQFLLNGQRWQLIHDPEFVAGKKLRKRALEDQLREMEVQFIAAVEKMAIENRWPFSSEVDPVELRIMGDAFTQETWKDKYK